MVPIGRRLKGCIQRVAKTEEVVIDNPLIFNDKRKTFRRLKWWGGYGCYYKQNRERFFQKLDEEVKREFGNELIVAQVDGESYCVHIHLNN